MNMWHSNCIIISISFLKVAYTELSPGFLNGSTEEIFLHERRVKLFFSALCVVFILFIIVLKSKSVNHNAFTKFFHCDA